MLRRFLEIRKVQIGLGIMIFFCFVAIVGIPFSEHVLHYGPYDLDMQNMGTGPDKTHWLGTTSSGQDVLSWMLYGTNTSFKIGLVSAVIGTFLTVVIGLLAGFCGGKVDKFLNGLTLVFQNIPSFAILFIVAGMLQDASWLLISIIIGVFEWSGGARNIRAQTLSLKSRDFTTSLKTIGESNTRIIFVETLPHLMGVISPMFLRLISAGINMQAALAFIGLGNASLPSWGLMINYATQQNALFNGQWWWFVPPGLAIALIGYATTMINFGFDEIANPTLSTKRIKLLKKYRKEQIQGAKG